MFAVEEYKFLAKGGHDVRHLELSVLAVRMNAFNRVWKKHNPKPKRTK